MMEDLVCLIFLSSFCPSNKIFLIDSFHLIISPQSLTEVVLYEGKKRPHMWKIKREKTKGGDPLTNPHT